MSFFLPIAMAHLGYAYTLSGRVTEGLPLLEQAAAEATTSRKASRHTLWVVWLAEGYLRTDRVPEASDRAEQVLELARGRQERGTETYTLWLPGQIAARRHPLEVDQAHTHYRHALTLANELGMRPLQAHCHRGLGMLYRQTGQVEHARIELSTAIEIYRDMAMTFWLPETESALADVEGR